MSDARRLWLAAVVAGVIAFAASYAFGRIPGLKPCGPSAGLGAIIAFEFVRSPADVAVLFGAEPCRATLIAAQRTGLLVDGLWFIPAYTAFLALAAWATGASWRRWLVGALLVAGLSDEVEGAILWSILNDLPGTQGQVDALWTAVHLKFALLALATAGVGWGLRRPGWRRFPGIAIAAAGLFAPIELVIGNARAMMTGFMLGWFALVAVAVAGALWPAFLVRAASPSGRDRPA